MATQVTLALPQGKEVQVQVPAHCHIHFLFAMEEVMFERSGKNLVLTAEDGGHIILEGFFGFTQEDEMPVFVLPGDIFVQAKDLMPLIDNTFESFRPNGAPCLLGQTPPATAHQPDILQDTTQHHETVPDYLLGITAGKSLSHGLGSFQGSQPGALRFHDVLEDDKPDNSLFPSNSVALPPHGEEYSLTPPERPLHSHAQPVANAPREEAAHAAQPPQNSPVHQPVGTEEEALHALLQHQSLVG